MEINEIRKMVKDRKLFINYSVIDFDYQSLYAHLYRLSSIVDMIKDKRKRNIISIYKLSM